MSYDDVMAMPIRAFWFMSGQIDRIRAEETLDNMIGYSVIMGGKHVPKIVSGLRERVGRPIVVEQMTIGNKDIEALKALFGGP